MSAALDDHDVRSAVLFIDLCAEYRVIENYWGTKGQPIGVAVLHAEVTAEEWLALYEEQQDRKANPEKAKLKASGPPVPNRRSLRGFKGTLVQIAYEKRPVRAGQAGHHRTTLELVLLLLRDMAAAGDLKAIRAVARLDQKFGRPEIEPAADLAVSPERLTKEEWLEQLRSSSNTRKALPTRRIEKIKRPTKRPRRPNADKYSYQTGNFVICRRN